MQKTEMNNNYFALFEYGVPGELEMLNTKEKLTQLSIAQDLFLFDKELSVAYLNAFIQNNSYQDSTEATKALIDCAKRTHYSLPLHPSILPLYGTVTGDKATETQLSILQALSLTPEEESAMRSLTSQERYDRLASMLRKNPSHLGAADALLELSTEEGFSANIWLGDFKCPQRLKSLWQQRLFLHYAQQGIVEKALEMWETLPFEDRNPYSTVCVADCYALAGDTDKAIAYYRMALKAEPTLGPVRRRLQELLSPQQVNKNLLAKRRTSICFYSWNKGEVLEQTLRSLAQTQLANSNVYVLLNGCTDDSQERMLRVQPLFGEHFHLIELPINIGAPAARNWLLQLPEVLQSDYIAFLDDDILLQEDWLVRMLSDMECDTEIGVVGCRVVNPSTDGKLPLLQYLYRLVDFAYEGIIKLSPAVPTSGARDTGLYAFRRECQNVMGCQHLFRTSVLKEVGGFDIRFSPSQVDDIDHDLSVCLKGYKVWYCGTVQCQHLQGSGISASKENTGLSYASLGSILGNDLKLCYKHHGTMKQLYSQACKLVASS